MLGDVGLQCPKRLHARGDDTIIVAVEQQACLPLPAPGRLPHQVGCPQGVAAVLHAREHLVCAPQDVVPRCLVSWCAADQGQAVCDARHEIRGHREFADAVLQEEQLISRCGVLRATAAACVGNQSAAVPMASVRSVRLVARGMVVLRVGGVVFKFFVRRKVHLTTPASSAVNCWESTHVARVVARAAGVLW